MGATCGWLSYNHRPLRGNRCKTMVTGRYFDRLFSKRSTMIAFILQGSHFLCFSERNGNRALLKVGFQANTDDSSRITLRNGNHALLKAGFHMSTTFFFFFLMITNKQQRDRIRRQKTDLPSWPAKTAFRFITLVFHYYYSLGDLPLDNS